MYLDTRRTRDRLNALSELERRLAFRISRLSKLLDSQATRDLAGSDLNLTGFRILLVLDIFGETTAADLSRLMVVDRAQISRAVADLTARGLLEDRPEPKHRRKRLLTLTEAGRAALADARGPFDAQQALFGDLLSDAEMGALVAAIDILSRHLADRLEPSDPDGAAG